MSAQPPNARTQSAVQRSEQQSAPASYTVPGEQCPEPGSRSGGPSLLSALGIAGLVMGGLIVAGTIYYAPDLVRYMKIKRM